MPRCGHQPSKNAKVPLGFPKGTSSASPALAGQRDSGTVIDAGGVAATTGATALRELAQAPEPLYFRLLVHDDSLAVGASWLDAPSNDVELGWFLARAECRHSHANTRQISELISEHNESQSTSL